MRQKGVAFSTRLSTKECADVFRDTATAARGFGARLAEHTAKARGRDQSGFFTPNFDSPFAAIEGAPDFAVGVSIGKFAGGANGAVTTIHMYIDDAQNSRSVEIVSPHGLTEGGRSGRLVLKFLEAFQAADPNLTVTDGNVR